jgi:hypothetical protein
VLSGNNEMQNTSPRSSVVSLENRVSDIRIAGNFRMVQNFAFFTDRLGTVKIRAAKN